jgi:hypothetical protein
MSTGTATSTLRPVGPSNHTTTPQIREEIFELRARTAEARHQAATLASHANDLHDRVQGFDLDDRAAALIQNDPSVLLAFLGDDLGMPWSLVADLINVSPTAVRKWRRGGSMTPETRARLARLVAFCQVLPEVEPRITDAVLWLQSPLISGATTLTPADLFTRGSDVGLLNRAAGRVTAERLLDAEVPDWRTATRPDSRHRVVEAPDGVLSIVPAE